MTCGASARMAFEARTALPGPAAGPYHAVFASTAKANASRHRPHVSSVRQKLVDAVVPRSIYMEFIMRALRTVALLSACGRISGNLTDAFPQGLKLALLLQFFGTAKAVRFQSKMAN